MNKSIEQKKVRIAELARIIRNIDAVIGPSESLPHIPEKEKLISTKYALTLNKRMLESEIRRELKIAQDKHKVKKPKISRKIAGETAMEKVLDKNEMKRRLGKGPGYLRRGKTYEDS